MPLAAAAVVVVVAVVLRWDGSTHVLALDGGGNSTMHRLAYDDDEYDANDDVYCCVCCMAGILAARVGDDGCHRPGV